eukprot:jgi/Psemu1/48546/gm1.48546_g
MLRGISHNHNSDEEEEHKQEEEEQEEDEELAHEILLEVLEEGRGDRQDRGERDEWNKHVGWHRKENVGVLRKRKQKQKRRETHTHPDRDNDDNPDESEHLPPPPPPPRNHGHGLTPTTAEAIRGHNNNNNNNNPAPAASLTARNHKQKPLRGSRQRTAAGLDTNTDADDRLPSVVQHQHQQWGPPRIDGDSGTGEGAWLPSSSSSPPPVVLLAMAIALVVSGWVAIRRCRRVAIAGRRIPCIGRQRYAKADTATDTATATAAIRTEWSIPIAARSIHSKAQPSIAAREKQNIPTHPSIQSPNRGRGNTWTTERILRAFVLFRTWKQA